MIAALLPARAHAQDSASRRLSLAPLRGAVSVGLGVGTHAVAAVASAELVYGPLMVLVRSLENANAMSDGVRDQGVLAGVTHRRAGVERHLLLGIVEAQRHRHCSRDLICVEPVYDRRHVLGFSAGMRKLGRVFATGFELAGSVGPHETTAVGAMFTLSLGRL